MKLVWIKRKSGNEIFAFVFPDSTTIMKWKGKYNSIAIHKSYNDFYDLYIKGKDYLNVEVKHVDVVLNKGKDLSAFF